MKKLLGLCLALTLVLTGSMARAEAIPLISSQNTFADSNPPIIPGPVNNSFLGVGPSIGNTQTTTSSQSGSFFGQSGSALGIATESNQNVVIGTVTHQVLTSTSTATTSSGGLFGSALATAGDSFSFTLTQPTDALLTLLAHGADFTSAALFGPNGLVIADINGSNDLLNQRLSLGAGIYTLATFASHDSNLFEGAGTSNAVAQLILIPEPGTMALFGVGLAGLVGYGYRRRQQAK